MFGFLFLLSLRRSFLRFRREPVQSMCDVVATEAFRELPHDARRMGRAVAALAGRHHLVLFLVTECAGKGSVLDVARRQGLQDIVVARPAVLRGNVIGIGHAGRCVRLVAFPAVCRCHLGRVRFVALRALRDLAVDVMTDGTVEGGVLALACRKLLNLGRMTVETVHLALERYIQRRVGLRMAVEAALGLEMGPSCLQMAFIARRDRVLHFGRMTHVAAHAGHAPVFSSCRCYVLYLNGMTLHAVIFCKRNFRPGRSAVRSGQ